VFFHCLVCRLALLLALVAVRCRHETVVTNLPPHSDSLNVCRIAGDPSESYVSWHLVLCHTCLCLESFSGISSCANPPSRKTRFGAVHVGTVTRLPTAAHVGTVTRLPTAAHVGTVTRLPTAAHVGTVTRLPTAAHFGTVTRLPTKPLIKWLPSAFPW